MERHHGSSLADVKPISLLTELPGLRGCGFYQYGAPNGARNCTAGWATRLPGFEKKVFGIRTLEPDKTRIIIDGPPAFLTSVPTPVPVPLSSWRLRVIRNRFRTTGFGVGQLRVRPEAHAKTPRR